MNKISKAVDPTQHHSDSDLSLQLSDASSLSPDSDLSEQQKKKKKNKKKKKSIPKNKKKKIKDDTAYCICRKGYDGKEFMIECDGCQEWFHGTCVGIKPNSIIDHYYCKSCLKKKKKSIIILPLPKPVEPVMPVISNLSIDPDDEDEDLCPVCDGDCTCGPELVSLPPQPQPQPPPPPPPPPSLPPPPPPLPSIPLPTPQPVVQATPKIVIKKVMPASKSKKSKKPKKTIHVKHNISSSDESNSSSDSEDSQDMTSSDEEPSTKKKVMIAPPRRGKSTTLLANIIRQKTPHYASKKSNGGGGKKSNFVRSKLSSDDDDEDEDTDEEVVVDDLDDLLETMSPLSEHSSNESNHSSEEFFTDEEGDDVDIDSATMSPYPEDSSRASYSSVHIDSGDDEDIENAETQAIIADMTLDSDEEEDEDEELDSDEEMFIEDEDDDDDDEVDEDDLNQEPSTTLGYYTSNNNHWSSDDDEDEEEEEFDYTTALPSEEDFGNSEESDEERQHMNPLLPLLDSEGNLYDSIAAAFMQSLGPMSDIQQTGGDGTHGANTPGIAEEYQLSPFELAHALSALSAETARQYQQNYLRRPSLPSNAVTAAQRNRGPPDFNTSEALRALSALASDELSSMVPLETIEEEEDSNIEKKKVGMIRTSPIMIETKSLSQSLPLPSPPPPPPPLPPSPVQHEQKDILPNQLALSLSTDLKLQEQILDILKGSDDKSPAAAIAATADHTTLLEKKTSSLPSSTTNASRQILPKPSGSGLGSSFPTLALEQQIQNALQDNFENKRKQQQQQNNESSSSNQKKRRLSYSTPASPAAIIDELEELNAVSMDDLVDTSQLYTRSMSRSPSPELEDDAYSRDLSRWQRIPIGAFRLMRSKNKLWLER